jgi:hypothetical protein
VSGRRGKAFIGATGALAKTDGVVDFPAAPLSLVSVKATSDVKASDGNYVAFAFFDAAERDARFQ